ncbi:MAG: response regulator [Ruminococcus sp.]|nr:response regulator [Ruminococcus sp.]
MKKKLKSMFLIFLGFLIIMCTAFMMFRYMNRRVTELNHETVQDVGYTYLSALTAQTVNHSRTYFSSKFNSLDQILDAVEGMELTEEKAQDYIKSEIESGATYIALLKENGERVTLRGAETFQPLDKESFDYTIEHEEDKVILVENDKGDRMIEMVNTRNFMLGGTEYKAMLCGIHPDTLNTVLNLSYGQEMVYSFVIRRADTAFVVRNENADTDTYFQRISRMYEGYNNMSADDYIAQMSEALSKNETYQSAFIIDGDLRMLYARPFSYSNWYLVTFMRYSEINQIIEANNAKTSKIFNMCLVGLFVVFITVFTGYAILSYNQIKKQNELRQEAVSANKAKSEFLSNMSHDIRTPMNVIIGMTDIAIANIEDKQRVQECLSKIARSSHHLLSLINDVLDMSKIESSKMTLSMVQISFRENLENVVTMIQPQINAKHQNFNVYINSIISEDVYCDSLRLNQILINLLSNAVKYTQMEGEISLTLTQEESPKGNEYVRNHIYVRDNGMGMTEDFVKVVFESFVREDRKRVTKEEGTGLGMAITKHIVDMMGGTIEVKSKVNEGSEFHVTLDLKKGDTDMNNMDLEGLKVLVIDDDEELCETAIQSLNEIGAYPEYATSCEEALELLKNKSDKYDVILVDWHMPESNGVETTKKLREFTKNDMPIILISVYDLSEVENEARGAGINGFILKPLFKSTLFFGIKQYMGNEVVEEIPDNEITFDGGRILFAEDNELNAEITTEILTEAGFEVDWAENGRVCAEKFQYSEVNYYKAILMDIRMPVMNGYEATRKIRAMDRPDSTLPIIAMTADAFAEDVAKSAEAGMNAHVAKPVDVNALFYILRRELNKYEK